LVEDKKDASKIRRLHEEFQDILANGKNMVGEVYLVDILHYFDEDLRRDNSKNLFSFLEKSKQNILIMSDIEQQKLDQDDIQKNLFKVCCAISNLQINQRNQNYMDDKLLFCYLDSINFHRDD
jgi:hypothetical protein